MTTKSTINIDYYNGIQGIYFSNIISNIIKIGNLDKTEKTILDFGCGSKILKKKLPKKKILNYDINPDCTEYEDYKKLHFDIVVFNHVLMYMEKAEIISTFNNIKKINENCELIIGIGKEGLINKLAAFVSLNFTAHKGTLTTYEQQKKILSDYTKILQTKKNIFFMTDVYYARFNN